MSHSYKYRSRALSTGNILDPRPDSDDDAEQLLLCSVKSEGAYLIRRASQGNALVQGFGSRPDTPTRVLESSFRTSSPSLSRTPKSVRFQFPEQDHYEALALDRKAKSVEIPDVIPIEEQVQKITETMQETVAKLLERETKLDLNTDQALAGRKGYYFQTGENIEKKVSWQCTHRTWLIIIATTIVVGCILLAIIPLLIRFL